MELMIMLGVLQFIGKTLGEHYINKILDSADTNILQTLKTKSNTVPDLTRVGEILEGNQAARSKVEAEIQRYTALSLIVPPSDALLTREDRLPVYEAVLNLIVAVMQSQQRDIVLTGFLHSPTAISCFTAGTNPFFAHTEFRLYKGLKQIPIDPADRPQVYVWGSGEVGPAANLNEKILNQLYDSRSYVTLDDAGLKKPDKGKGPAGSDDISEYPIDWRDGTRN